jgi:hypothetical protein
VQGRHLSSNFGHEPCGQSRKLRRGSYLQGMPEEDLHFRRFLCLSTQQRRKLFSTDSSFLLQENLYCRCLHLPVRPRQLRELVDSQNLFCQELCQCGQLRLPNSGRRQLPHPTGWYSRSGYQVLLETCLCRRSLHLHHQLAARQLHSPAWRCSGRHQELLAPYL